MSFLADLDVVQYLKNLFYENNNIQLGLLKTGAYIEFYNYYGDIYCLNVTIEGEMITGSTVEFKKTGTKAVIKESKL